jgi:magnesium transporter
VIRVFSWDKDCKDGRWGGPEALPAKEHLPELLWVDLEAPTDEEECLVLDRFFHVHTLTLEDVRRPRRHPEHGPHFPKVEEFPDYLFVVVNPLRHEAARDLLREGEAAAGNGLHGQLSAVLTRTLLITHHYDPLDSIAVLRTYLEKHPAQCSRGPDFLFHVVLDDMVDEYAPLLDRVDESLDQLEEEVFRKPDQGLLGRLLQTKRHVISLRKTLIYEREVLARMSRGEFELIEDREMVYYRNVYDHLIRFTELIEASREMLMDLTQTLLASQANKLNGIMKVLTMISTTILPMALIAGIYGMNFEKRVWPDFKESEWGFVIALGMMLLSGLGAFGLFRWMKWL